MFHSWLPTNLERGRSELLNPIVVAVSPKYLAAASQKDIQESTKSNLSVVQFAKQITLAQKNKDEEQMKEVRHQYTFPDVPHRVMFGN
ncbi:hypothetical protein A4X13_0g6862 [Tilletia indica]|uniref:Uncharacterized protein n=1 Tax=Tilletia indica TaxID=43049 RepID=A0A8T8SN36_9BASI|nr:hypothetical protein A4X13_0g6862 [Tilletia indica]